MDKGTKIELLKIVGMVIILVALIWGIVWLNADHEKIEENTVNTSTQENNPEVEEGASETPAESITENENSETEGE